MLLPFAGKLKEADKELRAMLTDDDIKEITNLIPDDWLNWDSPVQAKNDIRDTYRKYLTLRLHNSEIFVKEALHAKEILI